MKDIVIAGKVLGKGQPCFIIAEAGVNHNGSLDIAKKLVDKAASAGADAVKFQTFRAESLVTPAAAQADYQSKNTGRKDTQYAMLKRLELKDSDFRALKDYCDTKGIIFLSTPFDEESIDLLDSLGVVAFKAGSSELNNHRYMVHMAKKGKPMIISTGMSTLAEIKETASLIKKAGQHTLVILHCTTSYPCPYDEVNLNAMATIEKETGCVVGYSDHTEGILVPAIAVAMGAALIEKHFTLDKTLPGPDHRSSLEPGELKEMVKQIRLVESIKGSPEKRMTLSEIRNAEVARKSIVAARDIEKGALLKEENLLMKRPGTGLPPTDLPKVLGRTAKVAIRKDELISMEKLL